MLDLRANLVLRAIDVDLLARSPRMIRTYCTDARDLRACFVIQTAARQSRCTDIAHLHILGQHIEHLARHFRRTRILLCLVKRIRAQQYLLAQFLHILHSCPPRIILIV